MNHLAERIFEPNITHFEDLCLAVFQFQFQHNAIYQKYCNLVGITSADLVKNLNQIPYLPIEFFKKFEVKSFESQAEKIFYSSATGKQGNSLHHVKDLTIYEKSFFKAFEQCFGDTSDTCFLGLLPSYLEREGSSLIYMVQKLMQASKNPLSGFFMFEHETLQKRMLQLEKNKQNYILFGVSFALLDFAEKFPTQMSSGKIIETGGMKGRKKEITRSELIGKLSKAFATDAIFSEYGMTELMSQAYAGKNGFYQAPNWMQIQVVDPNDPFTQVPDGKTGLIRIIDLANLYSCSFILSSDLGKKQQDGSFEVLGRHDRSELRGCSLLAV
jgi:hypothetical protein